MKVSESAPVPPAQLYEFGDFSLDAAKRLVRRREGAPVPLTPKVFDTLLYLVQHSGIALDKDRLLAAVWLDSVVEENNLNQNISALRRVFGEPPGSHRYILTLPGHGYRFVAEVKISARLTSPAAAKTFAVLPFKPTFGDGEPRPFLGNGDGGYTDRETQ